MKVHNPNNLPTIPIADLLPTQGELKDLTEKNYNKLKNNIVRRGFIDPVSVWEDSKGLKHLLNGHQRQRVLTKEAWNQPIPYFNIPAKDLQEAAAIVLELTSQYGTITQEGLDSHIAKYELNEADVYAATSYDGLGKYGDDDEVEVEEDEPPEVSSEPPVSELGVVYQLGKHRVMCGDSTKDADNLFDKATIGFTSPPYNAKRRPMLSERKDGNKADVNKYDSYDDDNEDYYELLEAFNSSVLNKCEYSFVNIQMLAGNKKQLVKWLFSNTDRLVDIAFWKKNQVAPAMAENVMNSQVELVIILGGNGSRAVSTARFRGNVSNYVETDNASRENENADKHNATYPVAFVAHFINNFTQKGDSVYDSFIGTGTTLIACEQTDRICYGMELDPKYVDVIRKRYAKFTAPDDQLPDNWEELTPLIKSGKEQAEI